MKVQANGEAAIASAELFDLTGQRVSVAVGGLFDVANLTSGVYLCNVVTSDGASAHLKIVVTH